MAKRRIKYVIPIHSGVLILSLISSFFTIETIYSQEVTSQENEVKKKDVYILATPTIGYNPTYGLKFGAGAVLSLYTGEPSTTSLSSIMTGISLTTKKQVIFTMQTTIYTRNNDLIFTGDWDYIDASKPTYGLGTGPSSSVLASNNARIDDYLFQEPIDNSELLIYKHIRLYETVSKKVGKNLFAGIGYNLDIFNKIEDYLLDTVAEPPVYTNYYTYNQNHGFSQTHNNLSGISFSISYDSRDNINNPYKGQYANISYRINPVFLGSNKNSSSLWMEYRKYFDLTKDHYNMLCFWGTGHYTISGLLPYTDLPAIGEDFYGRTGRGYIEGRFRGQSLMYFETEYRRHLFGIRKNPDFMGVIVFANALTASDHDEGTKLFNYMNYAAGAGIRLMISKSARTNLGLDYGIGNYGSSGFYLVVNETF
jgi:outer membrane protein assembly factor BamA